MIMSSRQSKALDSRHVNKSMICGVSYHKKYRISCL